MNQRNSMIWMSTVGIIGALFGLFYGIFGLEGLPVYKRFVPDAVLIPWSNGLYGAVFIGFSVLLFFVGRHAFKSNDKVLMKALLYGIAAWLVVEALFSLYYGIYFNIVVDIMLMVFLGFPLLKGIQSNNKKN